MSDLLIIIPAYNEEDNIERVVDRLTASFPQYDYVVVNDELDRCVGEVLAIIARECGETA